MVFENMYVAAKHCKLTPKNIFKQCLESEKDESHRSHIKRDWMFFDETSAFVEQKSKKLSEVKKSEKTPKNAKTVVCLNNGLRFNTLKEAAKYGNVKWAAGISKACKIEGASAGKHPETNARLYWAFLSDFISGKKNTPPTKLQKIKPVKVPKNRGFLKVVCLNTKEVFQNVRAAAIYGKTSGEQIRASYRSERFSAGVHPETNEPLYWAKEEDFLCGKKTLYPGRGLPTKQELLSPTEHFKPKQVVCLNTQEVFKSIKAATRKYNTQSIAIANSARHERISAGTDPETGERLFWAYLEDYISGKKTAYPGRGLKPLRTSARIKVRCITTDEIFDSVRKALIFANGKHHQGLIKACEKGRPYGVHPITKEKLYWVIVTEVTE